MIKDYHVERAAYAIYCEFIRGAVGTIMPMRDENGVILKDSNGRPIPETPEAAMRRRWERAPDETRESFRREATAALMAAQ